MLPAVREEFVFVMEGLRVFTELREPTWVLPTNHLALAGGEAGAREAGGSCKAPPWAETARVHPPLSLPWVTDIFRLRAEGLEP